jgi:hypothetical protein
MIDGRTYCKCAVGVAIACMEDFRPKGNVTPAAAARYIREVLELALCNSGIEIAVQPIAYPASSKIPLNITLMGIDQRLLWFYPQLEHTSWSEDLEELIYEMTEECICIPA